MADITQKLMSTGVLYQPITAGDTVIPDNTYSTVATDIALVVKPRES